MRTNRHRWCGCIADATARFRGRRRGIEMPSPRLCSHLARFRAAVPISPGPLQATRWCPHALHSPRETYALNDIRRRAAICDDGRRSACDPRPWAPPTPPPHGRRIAVGARWPRHQTSTTTHPPSGAAERRRAPPSSGHAAPALTPAPEQQDRSRNVDSSGRRAVACAEGRGDLPCDAHRRRRTLPAERVLTRLQRLRLRARRLLLGVHHHALRLLPLVGHL
mmetsp:Transcript_32417/g.95383  ORF Transcript_32417/g.95383 Transcript_32417/m.95383 type:complete len:222 (+) Transcript_32417:178-843(+)